MVEKGEKFLVHLCCHKQVLHPTLTAMILTILELEKIQMINKFIIFGHGKRVRENIIPALKNINPYVDYETYTKSGKYLDGYVIEKQNSKILKYMKISKIILLYHQKILNVSKK